MKDIIVLLHGWSVSREQSSSARVKYRAVIGALQQYGYDVVAPDLPGFGLCAAPARPYTLADYAQFLSEFLSKHEITRPIILGHSFGGRVVLKFQQLYPKDVRALILSGTPGISPVSRSKLLVFMILAKLGKAFFSLMPFSLIRNEVRRLYYYLVGARDFYRAEGSMRTTFKNIVKEPLEKAMKSVSVSCLLIWGEKDSIVPVRIAYRMRDFIPGAKLVIIPQANHDVLLRKSTEFTKHVHQFLSSI